MKRWLLAFDLDDTLWDNKPVIEQAENAGQFFLEAHAPEFALQHDIEKRRQYRLEQLSNSPGLAANITQLRSGSLQQQLEAFGYDPLAAKKLVSAYMECFMQARQAITPFPQVEQTLESLSNRFTLATITNGNADIFQTTLSEYFRHGWRAEQLGVAKPDPGIFKLALAQLGIDAKYSCYIGDHPYKDVEAPRQAGMKAVWVNYHNKPWPAELEPPDDEISDFNDLPNVISRLTQ